MCLAVPGRVVQLKGNLAKIDIGGQLRDANAEMVRIRTGDYVLVSKGMVIEKLDRDEAKERMKLIMEAANNGA